MIVFIQRIVHNPRRSQQMGLQMAVSPSRRQFVSPAVSKWQSLSAKDSLLTFSQQGLQMAVSPNRRQFVPLAIGKWQSFPKKRQFVYLTIKEIDKWQFLQTVCLFLGCLVPHRVDKWQFSYLRKQFVDSPGTSRRMAVFALKTVRPPSNKVISPSKERGPI